MDLSVVDIILITLIMATGSFLQASAGFGSGLVAIPLLGFIEPQLIPGPLLFAYLFLTIFMAHRERDHLSRFHIRNTGVGLVIGTLIGTLVLLNINSQAFPTIASILVLFGVVLSFMTSSFALTRLNICSSGLVAGVMSTLAGLSGPPLALLLQFQSAPFVRANLAVAFVFSSLLSIAALALTGHFSATSLYLGLCLVPGMYLGYFFGQPVSRLISQKQSRYTILLISTLSALSLMYKEMVNFI
ncbi:sulfite exporter TauE/SafE family protein [Pseudoalteromonas luteoviolacea]|uniref:Probable membrane transporter protein n=1 Tax=Pseudoalteromonas luteoviolacea S4054 TaxID=1129367 RepID=A0A0F6ADX4_9GAMM|nr:sulfite exporter TauE/SafE family protein [Pseudoalteromonas luteoviolacea]AOT09752.1 hypothetical protein S4054249_18830 [Pseudoalteromonas luteoviolacea]AOT14665.1 hypothetical protein S40542_18800 [Pseudoalteromonas luteoviolacea]AOT19579.1 hypothetical protein S4054_18805 [Pseudoalteromonas luteoviolacea]KKE84021.1 hypothetical protein N479_11455 [Pseudoalteromonas luteoviolacea S4054]KZN77415.1 hypothetical protein N481_04995 [Pseudoalteromonas luteoviolacea S4047-1]